MVNQRPSANFEGFVESEGCVAVEAASVPLTEAQESWYEKLQYLGRYSAGGISLLDNPCAISAESPFTEEIPYLHYDIYLFSATSTVQIILYFTMALDAVPNRPLRYDVGLDDSVAQAVRLLDVSHPSATPTGWSSAVQEGVWMRRHTVARIQAGSHKIRYRPLTLGLVLEKLIVDTGGVKESCLGPPASKHVRKQIPSGTNGFNGVNGTADSHH